MLGLSGMVDDEQFPLIAVRLERGVNVGMSIADLQFNSWYGVRVRGANGEAGFSMKTMTKGRNMERHDQPK
jgi:ribosomal protein S6E (S10)